jgi:hypothetical protein
MPKQGPTTVLVHGAFAESASWNGVIERLRAGSLDVVAVAIPALAIDGLAGAMPRESVFDVGLDQTTSAGGARRRYFDVSTKTKDAAHERESHCRVSSFRPGQLIGMDDRGK